MWSLITLVFVYKSIQGIIFAASTEVFHLLLMHEIESVVLLCTDVCLDLKHSIMTLCFSPYDHIVLLGFFSIFNDRQGHADGK